MAKKTRKNKKGFTLDQCVNPPCSSPNVCTATGRCMQDAMADLDKPKKPGQPAGPPGNVTGPSRRRA